MWRSYIVYKIYTINPSQELKSNIKQNRDSLRSIDQRRKSSIIKLNNSNSIYNSNIQMALRYINDTEISL